LKTIVEGVSSSQSAGVVVEMWHFGKLDFMTGSILIASLAKRP
jgi:hypothetical protein